MGTSDEKALWFKGKRPIVREYDQGRKSVLSGIAGQSFCRMPGFAKEILTSLELSAKEQLSGLNFEILQGVIERELKLSGLEYNLAYKNALLSWEIEKQGLLADFERELADVKRSQKITEEELDRLKIEIGLRVLVIEAAKLSYALTEEEYKQRAVTADASVNDADTDLIAQKMITAQKRLDLVSYLEELIEAEQRLLASETDNYSLESELVDAKVAQIAKEAEKIDPMMSLAAQKVLLAQAIEDRIAFETQIVQEKLNRALLDRDKVDADLSVMEAETELNELRRTLNDARVALNILKSNNQISLEALANTHKISEMTAQELAQAVILAAENASLDQVLATKLTEDNIDHETARDSSDFITKEENEAIYLRTNDMVRERERSAEISAAQNITAKLTHILSE